MPTQSPISLPSRRSRAKRWIPSSTDEQARKPLAMNARFPPEVRDHTCQAQDAGTAPLKTRSTVTCAGHCSGPNTSKERPSRHQHRGWQGQLRLVRQISHCAETGHFRRMLDLLDSTSRCRFPIFWSTQSCLLSFDPYFSKSGTAPGIGPLVHDIWGTFRSSASNQGRDRTLNPPATPARAGRLWPRSWLSGVAAMFCSWVNQPSVKASKRDVT
jgi:hypothetical protein